MTSVDLEQVARTFLLEMQTGVRGVDYARVRQLFAEDVVAFGTYAAVVSGRDRLEEEQWRKIWPNIREFTFRLSDMRCLGSASTVCVVVPWDSLGLRPDGSTFARPGRASLVLELRDGRYVATHSHFSLAPAPAQVV